MKAMIFAAGLGTRLRPLTNDRPKALVEINGMTLLERVIRKLVKAGFHDIVVNVHHFANMVIDLFNEKGDFGGCISISDERQQLLETGGGLKKAAWFFEDGEPFLVHNVDVISNIDLNKLYQTHRQTNSLATLAVRNRHSSRKLLFNADNLLQGWINLKTGETIPPDIGQEELTELAFSGIHVIDPTIFGEMPDTNRFSIIHQYLQLAGKHQIKAYKHDEDVWLDVGKPDSLRQAEGILLANPDF